MIYHYDTGVWVGMDTASRDDEQQPPSQAATTCDCGVAGNFHALECVQAQLLARAAPQAAPLTIVECYAYPAPPSWQFAPTWIVVDQSGGTIATFDSRGGYTRRDAEAFIDADGCK